MKKYLLLLPFAILALVAAGCSEGTSEKSVNGTAKSSVKKEQGFSVSLGAQPASAEEGGAFSLTLNVRNLSDSNREFTLPSAQTHDFLAFEPGGAQVWRLSEGMVFAQALQQVTLEPGENRVYKAAWEPAGQTAGIYLIQGYFLGLPDVRPEVEVTITKP